MKTETKACNNAALRIVSNEQSSMMVKLIDTLAGEEASLQVEFQEFTFNLGKTKHTINGVVNLNVFHVEHAPDESMECKR